MNLAIHTGHQPIRIGQLAADLPLPDILYYRQGCVGGGWQETRIWHRGSNLSRASPSQWGRSP